MNNTRCRSYTHRHETHHHTEESKLRPVQETRTSQLRVSCREDCLNNAASGVVFGGCRAHAHAPAATATVDASFSTFTVTATTFTRHSYSTRPLSTRYFFRSALRSSNKRTSLCFFLFFFRFHHHYYSL